MHNAKFLSRKLKLSSFPTRSIRELQRFFFLAIQSVSYPTLNYFKFNNKTVLIKSNLASYEDLLRGGDKFHMLYIFISPFNTALNHAASALDTSCCETSLHLLTPQSL